MLASLREDPDFYGVLRPREAGSALGLKAVDRDTALLFLTLAEPGPLPSYARLALREGAQRTAAQLVADGVLEAESGGGFVSGPAALALLRDEGPARSGGGTGRLAALSVAALRYAQDLAIDDPLLLSGRLYGYNHRPLTPAWKRRLPGPGAVLEHLGLAPGGANRALVERHWSQGSPSEAWIYWHLRAPRAARPSSGSIGGGGATWKLYVSPAPEALAESFGAVLEALAAARAQQFKIGSDAWGLLRADKIVSYFPSFEALAEAAEAIAARLAGIPAQGVPFTSEIGGDGLVSWGVDPPSRERSAASWIGQTSWRLWLTHRLARALLDARAVSGVEPWSFALERLRLEGIDPGTWTPTARLFQES